MSILDLIIGSLFRNPLRLFFTTFSLVIAFLLFGVLQAVSQSFRANVDIAGMDRIVVGPKYSIIDPLPLAHMQQMASLPGIIRIAHQTWFGGTYIDPQNSFSRWAVSPRNFMDIHDEYLLPEAQLTRFIATPTAAIVGRETATKYGMKVGDRIPLIADIWPNENSMHWEFDLVGIYDGKHSGVDTTQLFFNYQYFNEKRAYSNDSVSTFLIQVHDPTHINSLAQAIDNMFANSSYETKTASEREYEKMFSDQIGDVASISTAILSAVFFTILLMTGNTMSQVFRERIPELAVLKTLGFSNQTVLLFVLSESVLCVMIGAFVGLFLSIFLAPALSAVVPVLEQVTVSASIFLTGLFIALVMGLVIGLPSSIRSMQLNIVEALRGH